MGEKGNWRSDGRRPAGFRVGEALFRAMIEKSQDGISLLSADVRTIYQSPAVERIFGYPPEEASQISWSDFVSEEDRPRLAEALAQLLAAPSATVSVEFRMRHRDGTLRWTELTAKNLLHDPDINALVTNFRDVTERKTLERERDAFFDLSLDLMCIGGVDGRFRRLNQAWEGTLGWSIRELLAEPWLALVHPDDQAATERSREQLALGTRAVRFENRFRCKDGGYRWLQWLARPVEEGVIFATARDVTEQRRLQAQLVQAQKMEAIGNLAGGVAHDFNNLLVVIQSGTALALQGMSPGDAGYDDLQAVEEAGKRAAGLTRQLLAFSRKPAVDPQALDLNELARGFEKVLLRLLGGHVELSLRLAPKVSKIHADPGQVEQVIMNLVINARDAMPKGGQLTLETADANLDEDYARAHDGVTAGAYVMLAVTDTGEGMDAATLVRIFEPFFTTKASDKGTGLGLSTVYGIVKQSGAHIWVDSEPGHGTTFRVYFPRGEAA